jgi:hypothetical protein
MDDIKLVTIDEINTIKKVRGRPKGSINENAICNNAEKAKEKKKERNKQYYSTRGNYITKINTYKKRYGLTEPKREQYENKNVNELIIVMYELKNKIYEMKKDELSKHLNDLEFLRNEAITRVNKKIEKLKKPMLITKTDILLEKV